MASVVSVNDGGDVVWFGWGGAQVACTMINSRISTIHYCPDFPNGSAILSMGAATERSGACGIILVAFGWVVAG
jgi:hypothetical protein